MATSPWRLKARWVIGASWREFLGAISAPLRERLGLVPIALYGLVLFGAFQLWGWVGVLTELTTQGAIALTAAYTIPVFVAANLVAAPLKARAAAKKQGRWHKDEFIYDKPVLVHSQRITSADHCAVAPFKVNDIPSGAYISYEIELHPPNRYWSAVLGWPHSTVNPAARETRVGGRGGIRIGKKRQLALITWSSRDDVSSTIARVWVHSWHAGAVPL